MKTKAEAKAYALNQLDETTDEMFSKKEGKWHYGKCDLWELLDFIYGDADHKQTTPSADMHRDLD